MRIICIFIPLNQGKWKPEDYHYALIEKYYKYGKIFKEKICGHTRVHLFDPEYVKIVYNNDTRTPKIPPLMETVDIYRKSRDFSPGLGFT